MAPKPPSDTYSEEETQRRVQATLRAAFNTPRPKKDVPRKRAESKDQKAKAELKAGKTRRAVVAAETLKPKKARPFK
jgi:hypothetical protein